mmetsp:Transcript_34684/g.54168  ORF Transcript_34684/g.54168 Transcript_34684/m.54168 type:complete len:138 (-) Transcript_34684:180-593(-)
MAKPGSTASPLKISQLDSSDPMTQPRLLIPKPDPESWLFNTSLTLYHRPNSYCVNLPGACPTGHHADATLVAQLFEALEGFLRWFRLYFVFGLCLLRSKRSCGCRATMLPKPLSVGQVNGLSVSRAAGRDGPRVPGP